MQLNSQMIAKVKPIMSTEWLSLWALALSLGWLVPNHFPPWAAFHADVMMAAVVTIGSIGILLGSKSKVKWHGLASIFAILSIVPWIQFGFGILPFAGQSWLSSIYLFGFLLSMLVGSRWEAASSFQLSHAIFIAIAIAAVISVWLQFYTWLSLSSGAVTDIWSMGLVGNRPYANLGQPNNLATLLLWGTLAFLWAYLNGVIGGVVSSIAVIFILMGVALTQSRMGLLAATFLLCAVWGWRHLWQSKKLPVVASALFVYYLTAPFFLRWLHTILQLDGANDFLRLQQQGELRLSAWGLFFQAVLEHPWFGYGWSEVGVAQLAVADKFPGLGVTFGHSHNLFLDLVLWLGLPLGLLVSGLLILWFWRALRFVHNARDAVLVMFLGVVGLHAMVELPLHYAYFLLPTGLVIGIVNARSDAKVIFETPYWSLAALWVAAVLALGVTVLDYLRIESSYNDFRFEKARIGLGKTPPSQPPNVLVLTQMREWNLAARLKIGQGMTRSQIEWLESVTKTFPSAGGIYRLSSALAQNDQPDAARLWLKRICKITDKKEFELIQRIWLNEFNAAPGSGASLKPTCDD